MKVSCIVSLSALLYATAFGQSYLQFINFGAGLDSPFFEVDGTTRLSGMGWYVELLTGPEPNSVSPATGIHNPRFVTGYFNTGILFIENIVGLEGYAAVQVWDRRVGSFAEAQALSLPHGKTAAFPFVGSPRSSGGLPTAIPVNMPSMTLVPEPGPVALTFLGAATLLWFGRGRRRQTE